MSFYPHMVRLENIMLACGSGDLTNLQFSNGHPELDGT